MNRFRGFKDRGKLHPAVLSALVIVLACFLISLLTLSFTAEIGQAKKNIGTMLMTKLCVSIMESGSSLISYQSEEKTPEPLLAGILSRENTLYEYTEGNTTLPYLIGEAGDFRMNGSELIEAGGREEVGLENTNGQEEAGRENAGGQAETVNGQEKATGHEESVSGYSNTGSQEYTDVGQTDTSEGKEATAVEAEMNNTDVINQGGNSYPYYDVTGGKLTREFILTNGAAFDQNSFMELAKADMSNNNQNGPLPVGVLDGDVYVEESEDKNVGGEGSSLETMHTNGGTAFTLEQLKDVSFLIRNFYIVDPDTSIVDGLFDSEVMLGKDMTIKQGNDAPQILIYHTHSQEAFVDSREGKPEDTVVGVGTYLTEILEEEYGYNVIHDTTIYDLRDGKLDRSKAYDYAEVGVSKILEENPTIEVIIDLHRDGVAKRSTEIDGVETAQIMLFNGLSRSTTGPLARLDNPNQQDNLAFSLQLQLKSLEKYPGLFYKNYLKSYRFNLHLRPKSILMELGTYKNTLGSAKNAMEPFAEILDAVLQGK
jgi:stage II sporulation protein P